RPSKRRPLALVASISIFAWPAGAAFSQLDAEPVPLESLPNLPEVLENPPAVEPVAGDASTDPLRRARDALLAAGDHSAALPPAAELVARRNAASDPQYPADLIRLGLIHTLLGEFEAAERRYFEAIDVIQAKEGEFALD